MTTHTFTVASAHFGDLFWIGQLLQRLVDLSPPGSIARYTVIDQDRDAESSQRISRMPGSPAVVSYARDDRMIDTMGHDHPASLDRLRSMHFETTHLILLDSDCFPVAGDWFAKMLAHLDRSDAVLARDPMKHGLSHPCFMVIPTAALPLISFSEGFAETGIDTGRLVGLQLAKAGLRVHWDPPAPAFNRLRGTYYLGGSLYHHGSASFRSSDKPAQRDQIPALTDRFIRRKVERNQYAHSAIERFTVRLLARL